MRRYVLIAVTIASVAICVWLWLDGGDYYTTNPWDRPDHPDDPSHRSSGLWGHGLGLVGTGLLVINLSFLLRRHVKAFKRVGKLRSWMDSHVITGILGPLLIVYHTAFHLRTTVAIVAAVCLAVLVVTGIVGRFIYAMVPHTVAGAEMGREELQARLDAARAQLSGLVRVGDPLWDQIELLSAAPLRVPRTRVGSLVMLPWFNLQSLKLRMQLRRLSREVAERGDWQGGQAREAVDTVRAIITVRKRLHTLTIFRSLLRWWRSMHRIFAVVMILAAIVHVGVVLYFGYLPELAGP